MKMIITEGHDNKIDFNRIRILKKMLFRSKFLFNLGMIKKWKVEIILKMDFVEKNIYREKIETLRSKSNQIMRNFGTPYAKTCNMRNFECLLVDLILILFFEVT